MKLIRDHQAISIATLANTVVFTLPFTILSTAGTGTVFSAVSGTQNMPTNPNVAVLKSFMFTAEKTITYVVPVLSVSVLIVLVH